MTASLTTTAMSFTPPLPSSFQLASDEVHIWRASLDVPPETSVRLYATLSPDERTRSTRFHFERDEQRFIVTRGVLRYLLARYLQTQPGQISFVYKAFGKPDLGPEFANRLKFNMSHSADLALIAIAVPNVGVALEYVRAESDYVDIARHFFSQRKSSICLVSRASSVSKPFTAVGQRWRLTLKLVGKVLRPR